MTKQPASCELQFLLNFYCIFPSQQFPNNLHQLIFLCHPTTSHCFQQTQTANLQAVQQPSIRAPTTVLSPQTSYVSSLHKPAFSFQPVQSLPIQQRRPCFPTSHHSQLFAFQKSQQPFTVSMCPEVITRATSSAPHAALYPSFCPLFSCFSSPSKRRVGLYPEL